MITKLNTYEKFKGIDFARTLLVFGYCTCAVLDSHSQTVSRPNILFIMSDDHAYQAISAYSNKLIETPNIDRIAREGMLFQCAYVTNSICGPSRATILTGKYSHINGFKDNSDRFNGEQQTLPKILQQSGYTTAIIGKWHLGSNPTGFDFWDILPDQGHYYNPAFINMGKDTIYPGYVTDIIADHAIDWMTQNKSKPFFMMLHNKAPHRNWMPPIKYLDEFNKVTFPLPENFYDDYKGRIALQNQRITVGGQLSVIYDSKVPCDTCIEDPVNKWVKGAWDREYGRLTPEQKIAWEKMMKQEYEEFSRIKDKKARKEWQFQRYMEDYLRCIKSVDDNVGRVLDFLKKSGLDKNTIVIYASDQGFYLGEHGLYDKRFMYEESFRTPLIIHSPLAKNKGTRNADFVMNLDIAPTILDMAGIKIPNDMQGASMKPLVFGEPVQNWRKEIYYHYYEKSFGLTRHYGIRTERYKLIHFYDPVDSWELYDLQTDPTEMSNLIYVPDMKNVVADLKIRLKKLQEKYRDDMIDESPIH
jgi:arylsulfatase A-like enzyme